MKTEQPALPYFASTAWQKAIWTKVKRPHDYQQKLISDKIKSNSKWHFCEARFTKGECSHYVNIEGVPKRSRLGNTVYYAGSEYKVKIRSYIIYCVAHSTFLGTPSRFKYCGSKISHAEAKRKQKLWNWVIHLSPSASLILKLPKFNLGLLNA